MMPRRTQGSSTIGHMTSALGITEVLIIVAVIGLVVGGFAMRRRNMRLAEKLAPEVVLPSAETALSNAEPDGAAGRVVEREKVIERQVVVTRCGYCEKLTPVDLSACKSCGATL